MWNKRRLGYRAMGYRIKSVEEEQECVTGG